MRRRGDEGSADLERLIALLARVRLRVVAEDVAPRGAFPTAPEPVQHAASESKPMRLLLRVEEAAEVLAIGRSKVYELVRTGELPCVRIGRLVRISADDLRRLVERSRVTG